MLLTESVRWKTNQPIVFSVSYIRAILRSQIHNSCADYHRPTPIPTGIYQNLQHRETPTSRPTHTTSKPKHPKQKILIKFKEIKHIYKVGPLRWMQRSLAASWSHLFLFSQFLLVIYIRILVIYINFYFYCSKVEVLGGLKGNCTNSG